MSYRCRNLVIIYRGNLRDEWTIDPNEEYITSLGFLLHQRIRYNNNHGLMLTWKYDPASRA